MKKTLLPFAALPLVALMLAAGCSGGSVDFSVDNPTDAPLKLQIDGKAYEIPAHQATDVSLGAGEHSLDAPATGKIKFIVYAGRKGGLLNPSLSDYVIVSEAYVTDASKLSNFRPAGGGPFQLDGVNFNGPFRHVDDLFIEQAWRFGVREPFPDSVQGYNAGNGGNIFSKIFTAADFIAYFEKQNHQPGYFEQNRRHAAAVPRKPAVPAPLVEFTDPKLQNASLKLRDLYQHYLHAADPAEQKRLQDEYNKQIMDFITLSADHASSRSNEENERQNVFNRQLGEAMGRSAIVED
jgi:hypothetical protein